MEERAMKRKYYVKKILKLLMQARKERIANVTKQVFLQPSK